MTKLMMRFRKALGLRCPVCAGKGKVERAISNNRMFQDCVEVSCCARCGGDGRG